MARRRTEKVYEMHEINLPADLSCAYLIPISDLHIGDPVCNLDKFYRYRNWIEKTPNAFVILNGDILDAAIKNSIGDVYGATMQPGEQLELAYKILEPIKDRILALVSGNHENRIKKETGIDVSQIFLSGFYGTGIFESRIVLTWEELKKLIKILDGMRESKE